MDEWARGVSIDRIMFVASLLLRVEAAACCRVLKASGDGAPEHAVTPREMRLAISFLHRAGFGIAEVVDEGEMWLIAAPPQATP